MCWRKPAIVLTAVAAHLLLEGCLFPPSDMPAPANWPAAKLSGLHQILGKSVLAPFGYTAFCRRGDIGCGEPSTSTGRSVALNPLRWAELNRVNDYVNRNVPQIRDQDNYNLKEVWAYPNSQGGDCEDLVLLKKRTLVQNGWPTEALSIAIVRRWDGTLHAVLLVTTDRGDYVLDSLDWAIRLWKNTPYHWVKRQISGESKIWVSIVSKTNSSLSN